jgi:hypothetical protein
MNAFQTSRERHVDFALVEVGVGLAPLSFLVSVVASAIDEAIARVWKLRAK